MLIYAIDSFDKMQNMQSLAIPATESVEEKVKEIYPGCKTSGMAYVKQSNVYSKELFAYIEALAPVSPYARLDDPRIAGKFDAIYNANLTRYDAFTYKNLHDKIVKRLTEWMLMFSKKQVAKMAMDIGTEDGDAEMAASNAQPPEPSATGAQYTLDSSEDEDAGAA